MALGDSFFEKKVLKETERLEREIEIHPAFENFKKKFLAYLENNAETLATYSPEQLIGEARSFEELMALKDFLQEKYGNEQSWWDFYHVRRRELALSASYYGDNQFGVPVNPRIFDRGHGRGAQSVAVQRALFAKKFSFEQVSGQKSLWSAGGGKIPVDFKVPYKFFPPTPVERYMAFDLETTGLLHELERKSTGSARGVYSAGWVMSSGPEPDNYLQRILPPRAKGKWTGQAGTRPFFGHYIENEIIPRGERVASILGDKIYRTQSEKEIVERFISAVGQRPGVALLGYNIEQFDLPFMGKMAERHGLSDAWQAALKGRQIVDVAPMAEKFVSEQLADKYVGWQASMFTEMGLHPKGWKLEAVAAGLGYKPVAEGMPHTPVEDATMSAFVYEKLQNKEEAEKIWKSGGFERYKKVLAQKNSSLVPLSEFEDMLEVRGGEVFFKPQKMGASSLAEFNEEMLSRLRSKYGTGTFAQMAREDTAEKTTKAISKITGVGLGRAAKVAKFAAIAAGLGIVLPGHGVSNFIGGAAAIGGWKAAGLGLAKAGATGGTPYKLLAGALAYAGVKGLSFLDSPERQIVSATGRFQGEVAEEEAAKNESYYMPQLSGPSAPASESSSEGFNVLKAYGILGLFEKDKKITQQEAEGLGALVTIGAQNNALLQTISEQDASKAFKSGITWRDQAHAGRINTTLQEPNQLGEFGWYNPGSKTLAVNALIDPRDMGAYLGMAHATDDKNIESRIASEGPWLVSPSKMTETTVHEGLHAVWDTDIDPAHKRAFVEEATRQLEAGSGPDIDALSAKHPVYAQQVEKAKGNFLFGLDPQATEWVSNEMFAHRGASARFNTEYDLGKNSKLDTIVSQYINWKKKKQGGMPVFTGSDVDAALSAGGLTPAAYSHYASTARLRVTPEGSGIMFSGLSEGGGAKGTRHTRTDFGSPYRGPKITGPVAAALVGAGILLTGGAAAMASRSVLRPRTVVHGQEIDPRIMAFREEWIKDKEKRAELKKLRDEAYEPPGEIDPWRIKDIGQGMALVNTEGLKQVWEDADTLKLEYPWYKFWKSDISIRLSGVDAPELSHPDMPLEWTRWQQDQPHGQESLKELQELVGGKSVDLVISSDPKQRTYGRYIGLAHRPGSDLPLNIELIQKGIAAALPWGESGSDLIDRETLISTEREAMQSKRGMWESSYWQRYADIAQGARRRITFTSFSDLERLSADLNLASAEALMRAEDVKYESWMGRYIGTKLRRTFGGSGRGKEKEGIHPGAGPRSLGVDAIRGHSDFGTGAVKGALKRVGRWLTGGGVTAPAHKRGLVALRVLLGDMSRKEADFALGLRGFTTMKDLGSKIEDLSIQVAAKNKNLPITVRDSFSGLQREAFEKSDTVAWSTWDTQVLPENMKTIFRPELKPPMRQTVPDMQVFYGPPSKRPGLKELMDVREGATVELPGSPWHGVPPELKRTVIRPELVPKRVELPYGVKTDAPPYPPLPPPVHGPIVAKPELDEFAQQMRQTVLLKNPNWKYPEAPIALHGTKFPGMPDEGIGSSVREELTEFKKKFASRWDPLRKLAVQLFEGPKIKTAEDAFQAMLKSESFKSSIREALEAGGEFLGQQGRTSAVKKYAATYKGLSFNFIGKEFHSAGDLASSFGGLDEVAEAYRAGMINAEASALKELGHARAPSFYGTAGSVGAKNMKKDVLLMEMFQGAKEVGIDGQISRAEKADLVEFLSEAHSKGIFHMDMHGENVMRVAGEGGKTEIAVIDWAMANRMHDPNRDKWVWDLANSSEGWKSLASANNITPEIIEARRLAIQGAVTGRSDISTISGHIDMARANLLGMSPAVRETPLIPAVTDSAGNIVKEARTIGAEEGDAFFNDLISFEPGVKDIVSRTRSRIANSQEAIATAAQTGKSAVQQSVVIAPMVPSGKAAEALRAQEKKFPSVAVPWISSQNAGRRHQRFMSKRSGG